MSTTCLDGSASKTRPTCTISPTTQILILEQSSADGRLEHAQRIQERIRGLENEIQLLKQRQNDILPLPNRLPIEILSEIFHVYRELIREATIYKRDAIESTVRWLRFTHVCQYWRRAALACTAVWANPVFNAKPKLTQLMLDRSRNAKLTIQFKRIDAGHNAILLEGLSNPDRLFRELTVTCNDKNNFELSPFLGRLENSSACLRKLQLEANGAQNIKLPTDFTLGSAPVLTHLSLIQIDFQWENIPLGPAMQSLILAPSQRPADFTSTWATIRRALSMAPNVSYLKLQRVLADGQLPEQLASNPLDMPNLRRITVEDSFLAIGELFYMLRAPWTPNSVAYLTFTDRGRADVIDRCLANIQDIAKNPQCQMKSCGILDLRLGRCGNGTADIQVLLHRSDSEKYQDLHGLTDMIFTFLDVDDAMKRSFMTALKTHLGLCALQELRLMFPSWMSPSMLAELFADLPALRLIKTFASLNDVVALLALDPARGAEQDPIGTQPYFPALRTLEIHDPDVYPRFPDVNLLIRALKCRPPSRQIEYLEFYMCWDKFDNNYPKKLRAAFPGMEVFWEDERTTGSDDSDSYPSMDDSDYY